MEGNEKPSLWEQRRELEKYVCGVVSRLQSAYLVQNNSSWAAGTLAELRRAVAEKPFENPGVWTIEYGEMPRCLEGVGDSASQAEWAVHGALTLYAINQQSRQEPMHKQGKEYNMGAAVRRMVLANPDKYENLQSGEMPRRFVALATANSFDEVLHYARQLVQQLRASDIPLDYGRLAGDLFDMQNPFRADAVRLRWGRGYTYYKPSASDGDSN